jgi:hypothetical protein
MAWSLASSRRSPRKREGLKDWSRKGIGILDISTPYSVQLDGERQRSAQPKSQRKLILGTSTPYSVRSTILQYLDRHGLQYIQGAEIRLSRSQEQARNRNRHPIPIPLNSQPGAPCKSCPKKEYNKRKLRGLYRLSLAAASLVLSARRRPV